MIHMVRRLLLLVLLISVGRVTAQEEKKKPPPPPLKIDRVRLGFPTGGDSHRLRLGAWVPVYVDVTVGEDDIGKEEYSLTGETSDGDGQAVMTTPVPAMGAEEKHTVLTYYRPGDRGGQLNLVLTNIVKGKTAQTVKVDPRSGEVVDPSEVLYLGLGVPLGGLRKALFPQGAVGEDDPRAERSLAFIDRAQLMPTRWYAYQGVDVVVLGTGNTNFVKALRSQDAGLKALGEWVARGGTLVLSVGRNFQEVRELLPRLGLRDLQLKETETAKSQAELMRWSEVPGDEFAGDKGLEVVRFTGKQGILPLASDARGPLVALSPTGMGKTLIVAFDIDTPAFTRWQGQTSFWQKVHAEVGPRRPAVQRDVDPWGNPRGNFQSEKMEMGASLQRGLENFDEVPVVSFGWVAFFILVYIVIVGPLDYLFLKKIVKRMELTWITFPLVVLIVSVAAYFTAYKLKGNHMRINKVDVVDIDLRDGEVQGTTWLSLFSPRVQAYTIGVEPAPDWVPGVKTDDFGTIVTTMHTPDQGIDGVEKPATQSLFRRPFRYAPDGAGLIGVPVPVWASRSFTASWRAKVDAKLLVEVSADFGPTEDGLRLQGGITSRLPVELTEVTLIYRDTCYTTDRLPSGSPLRLEKLAVAEQGGARNFADWASKQYKTVVGPKASSTYRSSRPEKDKTMKVKGGMEFETQVNIESLRSNLLMKPLLFYGHDLADRKKNNSGLRQLDQGWRVRGIRTAGGQRHLDEAVLIGRAVQPPAVAETISRDGATASVLWLGSLPGEGSREPLQGFLGQDTYVRIVIPITKKK